MKKRILCSLMALVLMFSMTACSSSNDSSSSAGSASSSSNSNSSSSSGSEAPAEPVVWGIASSQSGSFYYIAAAIGEVVTQNVEGVTLMGEATNGSVENCRRLNSGDSKIALATSSAMDSCVKDGTVDPANVSLIGAIYYNYLHIIAQPDSPDQLAEAVVPGVKIGVGEPGSGVLTQTEDFINGLGLTLDDVAAEYISQQEIIDYMIDGKLEVGSFGGNIPYQAAINLEAQLPGGMTLLNWSDKDIAGMIEQNPYIVGATIPGGTYESVPNDVQTAAWAIPMYCRSDCDEETIYEITKAIYSNSTDIAKIYDAGADFCTPEIALQGTDAVIENMGIDFHPGATRYFEEIGRM